jgi:hypothetical protein
VERAEPSKVADVHLISDLADSLKNVQRSFALVLNTQQFSRPLAILPAARFGRVVRDQRTHDGAHDRRNAEISQSGDD